MNLAHEIALSSEHRVVVGMGATGLSCARHFQRMGLPFSVVDTRAQPPGLAALRREMPHIDVYAGAYPQALVTGAMELVVSPGIAMDAPIVTQALAAGVDVIGDIDLFVREAAAPVVGITGSNAKSTVTELVGQMARDAQLNVGVGGNLGTPALELLAPERELYVLELSSFQLERAGPLNLDVATVLNISEDHLDRHGSMAGYRTAKHRIFRGCKKAVVNLDDPQTLPSPDPGMEFVSWRMAAAAPGGFGLQQVAGQQYLCHGAELLLPVAAMRLVGSHNVANALAALALGYSVGLPVSAMLSTLATFKGLPHRCEFVAEVAGVRYVNDSKGTNIGATAAALRGLGGARDILLIAGGQGKGADFSQLQQAVARHCKLLLLIGEDAPLLQSALASSAPVIVLESLEDAINAAVAQALPGDIVLLSPACASFDMFSGYAQRGEQFCTVVKQLAGARQ